MGLIARQAGAPIADGETTSGTEVEAEFNTVFTEINGALDGTNVATGADWNGSKLDDNSVAAAKFGSNAVTGAKVASDTITASNMTAKAVTQAYIDVDVGTDTTTTSASLVDIPGVADWTVTPGSTSNYIFMECLVYVDDGTTGTALDFAFEVNGVATAIVARWYLDQGSPNGWYFSWLTTAPTASSMVVKPQYLRSSGSATTSFSVSHVTNSKVFRGLIIPV